MPTEPNAPTYSTDLLIGADPELFLVRENGEYMSAHHWLEGTKTRPVALPSGGHVQVDGTAVEFNIEPARTTQEFVHRIGSAIEDIKNILKQQRTTVEIVAVPTADFEKMYFYRLPPECVVLGCEPDLNAWTLRYTKAPSADGLTFRTGGGHVHLGWLDQNSLVNPFDKAHLRSCIDPVRQLDATLYPLSLLWDNDNKRRSLYGLMGAFRPKPYGMEYRPLSNKWVGSKELQEFVFNTCAWAMYVLDNGYKIHETDEFKKLFPAEGTSYTPSLSEVRYYEDFLAVDFGFDSVPRL